MNIVALVGTLVPESRVSLAVETVAEKMSEETTVEVIEAVENDFGNFDPTIETQPEEVRYIRDVVGEADAVILATPLYNGSISGPLKNMIDALNRDSFDETRVGFVIVAGGRFPRSASEHLSTITRSLGGNVIHRDLLIPQSSSRVDTDSGEVSEEVDENASKFAAELES